MKDLRGTRCRRIILYRTLHMGRRDTCSRITGLMIALVMSGVQPALACTAICMQHGLSDVSVGHAVMHGHDASCHGSLTSQSHARIASVAVGTPPDGFVELSFRGPVRMDWHLPYLSPRPALFGSPSTPPPRA